MLRNAGVNTGCSAFEFRLFVFQDLEGFDTLWRMDVHPKPGSLAKKMN